MTTVAQEGPVSHTQSADIIDIMDIELSIDVGHSIVYKGFHPTLGRIAILNSSLGDGVLIKM